MHPLDERSHGVVITGRRYHRHAGGIAETQEMLDFCAANDITAEVEVIPAGAINEAYERMIRGDVRYRFVIDAASLGG